MFLPRGSLLLIGRDVTFFPSTSPLLAKSYQALAGLCTVKCTFCHQPLAELLFRVIKVCCSLGPFIQEELLEYLPILSAMSLCCPALPSVTGFLAHESSVSQHSGFQVTWSNNSFWTFFKIRCQRCFPGNLFGKTMLLR